MADLVRDHVSLREFARRAESFLQHSIKTKIDINAPIFWTIEGAAGSAGEPAAGSSMARKKDKLRFLVLATHLLKNRVPRVLGIGENDGNKTAKLIGRGRVAL